MTGRRTNIVGFPQLRISVIALLRMALSCTVPSCTALSRRRNWCGIFAAKPLAGDVHHCHCLCAWQAGRGVRHGVHSQAAEARMVQTTNRFFDEVARLMNDAAGVAQGVRREFETLFRNQAERFLRDLDVVKREEFEAVKDMARIAREENEALKTRIAALEAMVKEAKDAAKEAPPTAKVAPAAQEPVSSDAAIPNIDRPPE
jgi:BMFP domain-containing protein YqiC